MNHRNGFTLFEMLIALSVVMILATLAYPRYQSYLTRAYRNQAKVTLMAIAHDLAKYHRDNQSYQGYQLHRQDSHYQFKLEAVTEEHYLILAIPQKAQTKLDEGCGTLSLDNVGQRNISGKNLLTDCWN